MSNPAANRLQKFRATHDPVVNDSAHDRKELRKVQGSLARATAGFTLLVNGLPTTKINFVEVLGMLWDKSGKMVKDNAGDQPAADQSATDQSAAEKTRKSFNRLLVQFLQKYHETLLLKTMIAMFNRGSDAQIKQAWLSLGIIMEINPTLGDKIYKGISASSQFNYDRVLRPITADLDATIITGTNTPEKNGISKAIVQAFSIDPQFGSRALFQLQEKTITREKCDKINKPAVVQFLKEEEDLRTKRPWYRKIPILRSIIDFFSPFKEKPANALAQSIRGLLSLAPAIAAAPVEVPKKKTGAEIVQGIENIRLQLKELTERLGELGYAMESELSGKTPEILMQAHAGLVDGIRAVIAEGATLGPKANGLVLEAEGLVAKAELQKTNFEWVLKAQMQLKDLDERFTAIKQAMDSNSDPAALLPGAAKLVEDIGRFIAEGQTNPLIQKQISEARALLERAQLQHVAITGRLSPDVKKQVLSPDVKQPVQSPDPKAKNMQPIMSPDPKAARPVAGALFAEPTGSNSLSPDPKASKASNVARALLAVLSGSSALSPDPKPSQSSGSIHRVSHLLSSPPSNTGEDQENMSPDPKGQNVARVLFSKSQGAQALSPNPMVGKQDVRKRKGQEHPDPNRSPDAKKPSGQKGSAAGRPGDHTPLNGLDERPYGNNTVTVQLRGQILFFNTGEFTLTEIAARASQMAIEAEANSSFTAQA